MNKGKSLYGAILLKLLLLREYREGQRPQLKVGNLMMQYQPLFIAIRPLSSAQSTHTCRLLLDTHIQNASYSTDTLKLLASYWIHAAFLVSHINRA
jgi:hypothetical protein